MRISALALTGPSCEGLPGRVERNGEDSGNQCIIFRGGCSRKWTSRSIVLTGCAFRFCSVFAPVPHFSFACFCFVILHEICADREIAFVSFDRPPYSPTVAGFRFSFLLRRTPECICKPPIFVCCLRRIHTFVATAINSNRSRQRQISSGETTNLTI